MTWDILIPSIVHRTDMLTDLLEEPERRLVPGVGVLVYRDNREELYGPKCQNLYDASEADYVSMLDDDDWVADDYIPAVMEALKEKPDYVVYKVLYTDTACRRSRSSIRCSTTTAGSPPPRRCTATSATRTRSAATWRCRQRGTVTVMRTSGGRTRYARRAASRTRSTSTGSFPTTGPRGRIRPRACRRWTTRHPNRTLGS